MAQALLDLTYYKCGHCMQNFNSVAAFAKHQKELHTPKNAPKPKKEERKKQSAVEEIKKPEEDKIPSEEVTPQFEFILKLKLCQQCATSVTVNKTRKQLEAPLCSACVQRNGFF